jgi:hypothetical protein
MFSHFWTWKISDRTSDSQVSTDDQRGKSHRPPRAWGILLPVALSGVKNAHYVYSFLPKNTSYDCRICGLQSELFPYIKCYSPSDYQGHKVTECTSMSEGRVCGRGNPDNWSRSTSNNRGHCNHIIHDDITCDGSLCTTSKEFT